MKILGNLLKAPGLFSVSVYVSPDKCITTIPSNNTKDFLWIEGILKVAPELVSTMYQAAHVPLSLHACMPFHR